MSVDGDPFVGMQMRPASSTATASFVCPPASDIETPSSPTRNGLFGKLSMRLSSPSGSAIDRH